MFRKMETESKAIMKMVDSRGVSESLGKFGKHVDNGEG
jgi:hypothetical protein